MFCQKCGTENKDDGTFCGKCGNDLKSVKVETERKGITGKLGKMGILGFRSGKTWKMVIATFGYFYIGLILLGLIFGSNTTQINSPSATPVKTSQVSQSIAKIGDKVVAGDFAYTFNGMTTSKEIGENLYGNFVGKKADGVFIILDVTIENIGKESKTILIGSVIKIKDDQSRTYNYDAFAGIYLKEEAFTFTQLQPGLPKRGKIVFDVPENINGKFEIASGLLSGNYKYVLLSKFDSNNYTSPTQQAQSSNATEPTAKLGDKVVAGDFEYTFNSMTTSKEIGENLYGTFVGEKADGKFIILDINVENIGKESQTMIIDSYIKILDDQGRKFNHDAMAEIYLKDEAFSFTQLQPGLPKRGKIVFDVPENINGKIEIASGLWSSDYKYVLLSK